MKPSAFRIERCLSDLVRMKSVPARGRHDFGLDLGQQTSGTPVLDLFAPPVLVAYTPCSFDSRIAKRGADCAPAHGLRRLNSGRP
jgi:hypothetical protein